MTCIIAISNGRKVWMGGDSAATDGSLDRWTLGFPKVLKKDQCVYGFAGDPRIAQQFRASFDPPSIPPLTDPYQHVISSFLPQFKNFLLLNSLSHGDHFDGILLIGVKGKIFELDSHFLVIQTRQSYAAIGSGSRIALGSLHRSSGSPQSRINRALRAASEYNAGVAPPFNIIHGGEK